MLKTVTDLEDHWAVTREKRVGADTVCSRSSSASHPNRPVLSGLLELSVCLYVAELGDYFRRDGTLVMRAGHSLMECLEFFMGFLMFRFYSQGCW